MGRGDQGFLYRLCLLGVFFLPSENISRGHSNKFMNGDFLALSKWFFPLFLFKAEQERVSDKSLPHLVHKMAEWLMSP